MQNFLLMIAIITQVSVSQSTNNTQVILFLSYYPPLSFIMSSPTLSFKMSKITLLLSNIME